LVTRPNHNARNIADLAAQQKVIFGDPANYNATNTETLVNQVNHNATITVDFGDSANNNARITVDFDNPTNHNATRTVDFGNLAHHNTINLTCYYSCQSQKNMQQAGGLVTRHSQCVKFCILVTLLRQITMTACVSPSKLFW
jgi:hypothetical protein